MMLEAWHTWTGLTQGCHKPSTCKHTHTHTHTHTQSVKCNKVKPSRMKCAGINFKNSGGNVWRCTCLVPPKTSLICKFSFLLNLPPTNLEVTSSLVSPWPPWRGAVCRFQQENSQGFEPTVYKSDGH